MKNTVRKILSLALALTLLSAGMLLFAPTAVQADPVDTSWKDQDNLIYYYTDFYPSLSKKNLELQYGADHPIYYDYRRAGAEEFETLVSTGYFTQFRTNAIVIIDIKTFVPDPQLLTLLFSNLTSDGDPRCKTVLLTRCGQEKISSDADFLENVDVYHGNFELTAIQTFFNKFFSVWNDDGYTTYLIDGMWLCPGVSEKSLLQLCDMYPFIELFVKVLMGENYSEPLTEQKLTAFFESNRNVRILVHDSMTHGFYDVRSGDIVAYEMDSSGKVDDASGWAERLFAGTEEDVTNRICVFGTWWLESDCYEALYYLQGTYEFPEIPVFLFPIQEFRYGQDSLRAIAYDGPCDDEVAAELLVELDDLLPND